MIQSTRSIRKFSEKKNRQDLDSDRLFASAIIREFEVLGEAASSISMETRTQFPHIPWKAVIGMRNQLIHAYFDVDHDIVWQTIQTALPALIPQIEHAIDFLSK